MEGLPHDFYMTNYSKDIFEWRKNISKGEYNKSTIEYLLKLQYFNIYNVPKLSSMDKGNKVFFT